MHRPVIVSQQDVPPTTPGERLRLHRKASGLTIKALAAKVGGVHFTTVSKLETSQMEMSYAWAEKLANALGVSVFEILSNDYSAGSIRAVPAVDRTFRVKEGVLNFGESLGWSPTTVGGPRSFATRILGLRDDPPHLKEVSWSLVIDPDERDLIHGDVYAVQRSRGSPLFGTYYADRATFVNLEDDDDLIIGREPFEVVGLVVFQSRALIRAD
jgi:transcriptional regulator with XRE-family HTH domain